MIFVYSRSKKQKKKSRKLRKKTHYATHTPRTQMQKAQ